MTERIRKGLTAAIMSFVEIRRQAKGDDPMPGIKKKGGYDSDKVMLRNQMRV